MPCHNRRICDSSLHCGLLYVFSERTCEWLNSYTVCTWAVSLQCERGSVLEEPVPGSSCRSTVSGAPVAPSVRQPALVRTPILLVPGVHIGSWCTHEAQTVHKIFPDILCWCILVCSTQCVHSFLPAFRGNSRHMVKTLCMAAHQRYHQQGAPSRGE